MFAENSLESVIAKENEEIHREFLELLASEIEKARGGKILVLVLALQDPPPLYWPSEQASKSDFAELITLIQSEAHVNGVFHAYEYEKLAIITQVESRGEFAAKIDRAIDIISNYPFGRSLPERKIKISFGLSSFPFDSEHPEQLLQQAKLALKAAELEGGNAMGCYWLLNAIPFPPDRP